MIFIQKNNSILHKESTIIIQGNVSDTQKNSFFYTNHICHSQQNRWYTSPSNTDGSKVLQGVSVSPSIVRVNNRVTDKNNYTFNNQKIYKNIKPQEVKKKVKGVLGKIYISSTKNNTIITLIDSKGNTKGWSCSGSLGFKNARKSTTYAAQAAAENIVKKAKILGYTHLRLLVKGLGRGKQSCLRALSKSGLKIISIEDKTGIPYNGCRLSKKRRV